MNSIKFWTKKILEVHLRVTHLHPSIVLLLSAAACKRPGECDNRVDKAHLLTRLTKRHATVLAWMHESYGGCIAFVRVWILLGVSGRNLNVSSETTPATDEYGRVYARTHAAETNCSHARVVTECVREDVPSVRSTAFRLIESYLK